MNIEDSIEILKNSKKLYLKEKIDSDILEQAIETLLTAYEKETSHYIQSQLDIANVFKISVPIITNEESEILDYTIENDLDNIVHQISETVSRDRDIIILKKVIEKQSKEIEELKKYEKYYEEMEEVNKKFIAVDKIKAKIKEYYEYDKRMQNKPDWHTTKYYEAKALEKLLEE